MQIFKSDSSGNVGSVSYEFGDGAEHKVMMSDNVTELQFNLGNNIRSQLRKINMYGSGIESVPDDCYNGCSKLTEARFSSSIRTIGDRAFLDCDSLVASNILNEASTPLRSVGEQAFENTGIQTLNVNLEDGSFDSFYGARCFANCKNLKSASLAGNPYISDNMFEGCRSLVDVTIADKDAFVGSYSFKDCTSLKKITIPDKMKMLGDGEFQGCTSLMSVIVSDSGSLDSVGDEVFSGCTSLTSITLPKSVNSVVNIGENFLKGSSVQEIYLNGIADDELCSLVEGEKTVDSSVTFKKNELNYVTKSNTKIINQCVSIVCTGIELVVICGKKNDANTVKYQQFLESDQSKAIIGGSDMYFVFFSTDGTKAIQNVMNGVKKQLGTSALKLNKGNPPGIAYFYKKKDGLRFGNLIGIEYLMTGSLTL